MAFSDDLIYDKVEGGFITVPSPTPGVGKIQLLPKLADALKELPFLLCGPPGTGKHNLLKLATENAKLGMSTYDLGHISAKSTGKVRYNDLFKMLNNSGGKLQTNLFGVKSLLVLQGGEHLNTEAAQLVRKYDVVILANERTAPLRTVFGDRTVWANRLTKEELSRSLRTLHPNATDNQIYSAVRVADGDLRKGQRELQFGGGNVDKAGHVYFDVQDALCKGARRDMSAPCRAWLLHNHCRVDKSLEEHATFAENLSAAELLAEHNSMDSESERFEADSMAECVAGMATRKLVGYKRVNFSLENPPDRSSFPIKSAAPQKLCQEKAQLESYFADNVSMQFPWMPSQARNKYMHAIHGNGAPMTETTASDRPSKVAKKSEAEDVHTAESGASASSQAASTVNVTESRRMGFRAAAIFAARSEAKAKSPAPPSAPLPARAEQNCDAPSDSNIILELKGLKVLSTQPVASVNEDQNPKMVWTCHRQHQDEI